MASVVVIVTSGGDGMYCMFNRSGQHPEARGHLSEALTEDTGVGNSVAGSPLPLTTGNENLDMAIVIHLQYCSHLIQVIWFFHLYSFIFSFSDSKIVFFLSFTTNMVSRQHIYAINGLNCVIVIFFI